jgi:D-beta-D-heptose 7-phosphate kinase/D-beta-D-heptose 1-phosphate adenosyltransferase
MVIGDYMLDQQMHGAAERLSPDAPVPVLHATRFESTPGGAANVALCIQGLKGRSLCFGAVGNDQEATLLRDALHEAGCDVAGLIDDPARPTTIKRSLIGLAQHRHPQKMFRVDIESTEPLSDAMARALLERVEARIDDADIVLLEDYNKGVCTPALCRGVIDLCRAHKKPVLVDPAAITDYTKYRGATCITPNRSEAELATGLDTPLEATMEHNTAMARTLLKDLDLEACIITLDKHGALLALKSSKKDPLHIPTVARTVYDVTGAGDMVLAALAGARANSISWEDSVRFANAAAGLEVEVFGAQPIPFARVHRSLLAQCKDLEGKVRSLEDLLIELDVHRAAAAPPPYQGGGDGVGRSVAHHLRTPPPQPSPSERGREFQSPSAPSPLRPSSPSRIILTNGCFDVIHAGHVAYLREAKKLGDILVVAVNSDASTRDLKGEGRPVYSQDERLEILSELACVDYLVLFDEPTAHEIIRAIKPDVYVKGGDYQPHEVAEWDLLKPLVEKGVLEFRTIAFREGLSSTDVIERFTRAAEITRPSTAATD